MSRYTVVSGLLVLSLILISVHAGTVNPGNQTNNSGLNTTSPAGSITSQGGNPAVNISGSLLIPAGTRNNSANASQPDNLTGSRDNVAGNQTIPAGNTTGDGFAQNQSFTTNPVTINNSPGSFNQSPGTYIALNKTDVNPTLPCQNTTGTFSGNQSLLNETLKNQTLPVNNTTIIPVEPVDPLEQLIFLHANETPQPVRGTITMLSVGNPSSYVSNLFAYGNLAGWTEQVGDGENVSYQIRLYDLKNGKEQVIPVKGGELFYYPPSMDGENIVYTGDTPGFYGSAIYRYNIATNTTTLIAAGDQDTDKNMPVIQGHYVVYTVEQYDWDYIWPDYHVNMYSGIRLYDLSTGQDIPISPVSNETRRHSPRMSGDNIVWVAADWGGWTTGIERYNIPTGNLSKVVVNTGDFYGAPPTLDGDRMVYDQFQTGPWDYDIILKNITTGIETNLTPLTNETNQQESTIKGDTVVYINDEYGNNAGLYLLDLTTGIRSIITPDKDVSRPALCGDRIFWSQYDGSHWDFMMFTPGDPQPPVKADFSVNNTVGGLPLTLQYTDKSSGPVMTHHWEFGDGSESYGVDPVHTYTTPGRYDVSLTVSSPYYRDNKYVSELITAGAAPHASFVNNPPSGVAGLTVHFNDTSTGYKDRWLWDFGDNSTSTQQNTSHRYLVPGDYTVTFAAGNPWGTDSITGSIKVIDATFGQTPVLLPGLTMYSADTQTIEINESGLSGYTWTLLNNSTRLDLIPEKRDSLPSFSLFSRDGSTFTEENRILSGVVRNINLTSADLTSTEFSDPRSIFNQVISNNESLDEVGPNSTIYFTIDLTDFNLDSSIDTAVSRQHTIDEYLAVMYGVQAADWADGPSNIAYVLHCTKNNLTSTGPATITMSIGHQWVVHYSQFIVPEHRFKVLKLDENGECIYEDMWTRATLNTTMLNTIPVNDEYYYQVTDSRGINLSRIVIDGIYFDTANSPVRLVETDNVTPLPTSVTFAVNAEYIDQELNATRWHYVQEPMTIIRVNDTGSTEVLDTKFLYYDPVKDVDVFSAYSPNGLSEFMLAPVYTSGSPLQLLYLSFKERIPDPPPQVNNGGNTIGGNSVSTGAVNHNSVTSASAAGGGGGAGGGSTLVVSDVTEASPASTVSDQGKGTLSEVPRPAVLHNGPVPVTQVAPQATPANADMARVASQAPGSSIFSLFIEAAAMISVILIVVISVSLRYRGRQKD